MTDDAPPIPPIVALGGSAGGLDAFSAFFEALKEHPGPTGIAFVVLAHLPASGDSHLAELLARASGLDAVEVPDAVALEPDHIFVLPPGRRLRVEGARLIAEPRGEEAVPHPIDHLFASLGPAHGERAAAVVVSGTGADGSAGLKAVREHGGLVLAQSPESAAFAEMPASAIATGLVDAVSAPAAMASLVLDWAHRRHPVENATSEDAFKAILATLRTRAGLDLRPYKPGTLKRRIERRIHLARLPDARAYADFLKERPEERAALVDDLLITVTGFFRDLDAWEVLRTEAIAPLLERAREPDVPIRAWLAGCASGEEAYSLAILLMEEARARGLGPRAFEIFATDTSDKALERARWGRYPAADVADLPAAWREAYFEREDDHVRIRPPLRERIVFARHDLIADPPFSRVDLLVCRNVQIYLRPETQQKLAHVFHFALRDGGYLFLGNAESVAAEELFAPVSKAARLFRRTGAARADRLEFSLPRDQAGGGPRSAAEPPTPEPERPAAERARQALAARFAPPAVLVDDQLNVLWYHGATERFLGPQAGEPTHNFAQLAREGLGVRVRRLVEDAVREKTARSARVRLAGEGAGEGEGEGEGEVVVELEATPVDPGGDGALLLVSFLAEQPAPPPATDRATRTREQELEAEIRFLREENVAGVERADRARAELKSYNEEIISMNEELRATNEELETSKEELQSLNEELKTVNRQLRAKVDELLERTADLDNLLRSSDVATLFLDGELKIRWFSPAIEGLFNLRRADIGRPIGHFAPRYEDPAFADDCRRVLETVEPAAREIAAGGRWFVRRIQPYRTAEDRIEGVVVSFADVTALQDARLYAERIVETVPLPLLVLDTGLRVVSASPAFYTTFDVPSEETEGRLVYDLGNGQWNIPELRRLLDEVLPDDEAFAGYEVTHDFASIGRKVMRLNGRRLDHVQLILLAIEDVTAERELLDRLRESEERFRVLVDTSAHALWETDAAGRVVTDSPSWRAFTGQSFEQWRGDGWADVVHPDDLERVRAEWRTAVASGDVVDTEFRLRRPDGGWRWTHAHAAPLHDADGGIRKWVGMNTDISERKAAEEERELLLGELDHRVKNLFAVVRALASQFREERSAAEERRVFLDRLDALMRSHNLALAHDWRSVDLAALAREALAAYRTADDDGGVAIRGEPVAISPKAAQSLGLVFNELATNAVKYGALSTPAGRVELDWTVEADEDGRRVRLHWREHGGPPVTPPAQASFGTRLIERAFKGELGGDATLAYEPEGVRLEAVFPLR